MQIINHYDDMKPKITFVCHEWDESELNELGEYGVDVSLAEGAATPRVGEEIAFDIGEKYPFVEPTYKVTRVEHAVLESSYDREPYMSCPHVHLESVKVDKVETQRQKDFHAGIGFGNLEARGLEMREERAFDIYKNWDEEKGVVIY